MIYNKAMGPYEDEKRQAWAGILILLALIFILNLIVRMTARAMTRGKAAR